MIERLMENVAQLLLLLALSPLVTGVIRTLKARLQAARAGLDVVALTDHDTVAGHAQARHALPPSLILVPGMELSCPARRRAESGGARGVVPPWPAQRAPAGLPVRSRPRGTRRGNPAHP